MSAGVHLGESAERRVVVAGTEFVQSGVAVQIPAGVAQVRGEDHRVVSGGAFLAVGAVGVATLPGAGGIEYAEDAAQVVGGVVVAAATPVPELDQVAVRGFAKEAAAMTERTSDYLSGVPGRTKVRAYSQTLIDIAHPRTVANLADSTYKLTAQR